MTASIAVALAPVLLFLGVLVVLDSFKLVRYPMLAASVAAGAMAALLAWAVNVELMGLMSVSASTFSRYVSPIVEEVLKAAWLIFLIRSGRTGFLVDAAICGFAVGTGFGVAENMVYLAKLGDASLWLWLARGGGTAVLHGSTMAAFGMLIKSGRSERSSWLRIGAALSGAIALHSLFNHFFLPPLMSAVVLVIGVPVVILLVFEQTEKSTRDWLNTEFESQMNRLLLIAQGRVAGTALGRYLESLTGRFDAEVVADMLCLIRVQSELALRAKGILMAREFGHAIPVTDEVKRGLDELGHLRRNIGSTGLLAMRPVLRDTERDVWELRMLKGQSSETA